jgi:hypothetical protein
MADDVSTHPGLRVAARSQEWSRDDREKERRCLNLKDCTFYCFKATKNGNDRLNAQESQKCHLQLLDNINTKIGRSVDKGFDRLPITRMHRRPRNNGHYLTYRDITSHLRLQCPPKNLCVTVLHLKSIILTGARPSRSSSASCHTLSVR